MKKWFLIFSFMFSLAFQLVANDDKVLNELKQLPILNKQNIQILKYEEVGDGFYIIKAKTISANGSYVNVTFFTNKKILFVGKGFDLVSQREFALFDTKRINENIVFTIGNKNAKDEFYLITDIECPYCARFDESLKTLDKSKFKLNVLFFPLSFHLYSASGSQYILSLPMEKREQETSKLISLIQTDLASAIKKTEKFNNPFLTEVSKNLEVPQIQHYVDAIKKAYKIEKLNKLEFKAWLDNKIKTTPKNNEMSALLETQLDISEVEFGVRGTPSLFDVSNRKVEIGSFHDMYKLTNYKALTKLEKNKDYISFGNGKKPLHIVLSTKCSHCIRMINDKNLMSNISAKYSAKIYLMPLSNNPEELEQIKEILSAPMTVRYELLEKAMNTEFVPSKVPFGFKIDNYLSILSETGINQTPTLLDGDFKELTNLE